jgi:hypothetical protein
VATLDEELEEQIVQKARNSPGRSLVMATVALADGKSSQVNVANLERQRGNPPL